MRATMLTLVLLSSLPSMAFAQFGNASRVHSASFGRRCGCESHACKDCDSAKNGPPRSPSNQPPSGGQFLSPPANGVVRGGSNSVGIEGPSLHIPAMTLKLPTLQLPNLFRLRRGPSMMIDAQEAPYIQKSPNMQMLGAIPALSIPTNPPSSDPGVNSDPGLNSPSHQKATWPNTQKTVSTTEAQHLREQLLRREQQMEQMAAQIDRLQQVVEQLAMAQMSDRSHNRQASISFPASPQSQGGVQRPATLGRPTFPRPAEFPSSGGRFQRLPSPTP